jgi:hypothetical protein
LPSGVAPSRTRCWVRGAMTDRLEHHLAADHELDRLAQLPRRRGGERTMRPRPKLAAETRADELRDDADVLFRQAEHLREHARRLTTPCDDSYSVSIEPSQIAVVACSSIGLCVSAGVT